MTRIITQRAMFHISSLPPYSSSATISPTIHIMSQDNLIKLSCTKCRRINYWSRKNKKKVERKIELKKFCNWCKKQTVHKESKK